jgi:putative inorganic carbon (HCO3(-)) transporter
VRGELAVAAGSPAAAADVWAVRLDWLSLRVVWAGAVVLPLAVWPFGFDVFVLPKLAALRLLVLTLAALRLAAWVAGRPLRRTPLDLPLALFLGSAVVSTAFAVNVDVAVRGTYYRYEGLSTILCYALLFWLSAQVVGRREASTLVRSLLVGGYLVAFLAVVQWAVAGGAVGSGAGESARTFDGSLRAASTMGNADALGLYLAMLVPLATHELLAARGAATRLLAGNVAVCIGVGMVLTYSRAAWLGAALGVVLVAARPAVSAVRARPGVTAAGALAAVAVLGWAMRAGAGPRWLGSALTRAATLADPARGSGATRLHIWHDALALIAARPWTGWGPDTFGIAYPRFATGDWTPGFAIDKAHNDLLQTAATQGLPGLAAQLCLLGVTGVAFWRGRRREGAVALFAAWLAYQVPLQAGFSWLPAAAPAWLLLAAAVAVWRPEARPPRPVSVLPVRLVGGLLAATAVLLAAPAVAVAPVVADTHFRAALAASAGGRRAVALRELAAARLLAPGEGVYPAETGDVLLDMDRTGAPGPDAEPAAARVAYLEAIRLGDSRPSVQRGLAAADRLLAAQTTPAGSVGAAPARRR